MHKVEDYITHIDNPEDLPFLRRPLFDVNLRLFKSSGSYHSIVKQCCEYIRGVALTHMEGYSKPFGMSGANVAIPFNIIGVVRNRKLAGEFCQIMINPKILESGGGLETALSNCGSIRLKEPIPVQRTTVVRIQWWDEEGKEHIEEFNRRQGSFTIQHEIEHNLGILIIDK